MNRKIAENLVKVYDVCVPEDCKPNHLIEHVLFIAAQKDSFMRKIESYLDGRVLTTFDIRDELNKIIELLFK